MAITALNTTTLTNAISSDETRRFAVGSTTNITAGTSFLLIDGELMKVQTIPASGLVEVMRGVEGTEARNHVAASAIYIGSGSAFAARQFDGSIGLAGDPGTLPQYAAPLGKRKRDELGNEYLLCDFGEAVFSRQAVLISDAFVATKLATTGRGRVGIVAEVDGGTSDQWGWVQIYGKTFVQLLGNTAEVSPSDAANGPTTLNTTVQTKFWLPTTATSVATCPEGIRWTSGNISTASGFMIAGIVVATDAAPGSISSISTATSHTGSQISVFLNYPFVTHVNFGE
jgi:hypothetical protein